MLSHFAKMVYVYFFVLKHIFEMSYNPFCQQLYIFTIIRSLIIFSNKGVSSWYCNKIHATKIFLHFLRTHNMHQQVFLQKMKHETEFGKKFKTLHLLFHILKLFIRSTILILRVLWYGLCFGKWILKFNFRCIVNVFGITV